ncbi:putative hydrolase of the HAD superfamily [Actinokineospora alba]|uniref:Putative hydrolase of the HAD superfamily n=1 Tax=Actinokineospora alba TaxID=504798 RepID=A0A1H0HGG9_9PSEU|nr:HAD-IA family hydrolase [Actinokineospora alba]TDP64894.1 putative hydrolase of the HAD superfamily [Actinokineospora alba]SDH48615.1 putative hydrolase of the HAD superfamily [Actinokineospora alba]SDO18258.1 putative hydrolase of the HAD superfamily [Actinokineospora alba]
MTDTPYDAVICDVDGVVRHWPADGMTSLSRAYGLPEDTLATVAFDQALLEPAILGKHTDTQWRNAVAEALTDLCGSTERATALVAEWSALRGRVDPDVHALLTAARRSVPVVLLSNGTTRLEADLAELGLANGFPLVNSARLGMAKPKREVYRHAAQVAGAPVNRCLFIDDTLENVVAAESLGMTTHHYRRPADLRHALALLVD